MRKLNFLFLALFLGMGISAFAQDVNQIVVAKVNDEAITLEEFNQMVEEYNENAGQGIISDSGFDRVVGKPYAKISTIEEKRAFLKEGVIKEMLLYQEALRRGLDKTDIQERLLNKSNTVLRDRRIIIEALAHREIKSEVTTEEVKEYYNAHKSDYKKPDGEVKSVWECYGEIEDLLRFKKLMQSYDDLVNRLSRKAEIEIYENNLK